MYMNQKSNIQLKDSVPITREIYFNTGRCKTCGLIFHRENIQPTCDAYFRCKDCRGINSIDCKSFFFCSIQ